MTDAAPRRRASRTFLLSLCARATRAGGRLLALWGCARNFSLEDTGHFAFWMTVGAVIALTTDFGLSELLLRNSTAAVSRERHAALSIRLGTFLALGALLVPGLLLLDSSKVAVAGGALLFGFALGIADFLAAIRRAEGTTRLELAESLWVAGAALAAGVVVLFAHPSIGAFALALGGAAAFVALLRLVAIRRSSRGDNGSTWSDAARTLHDSRWLWPRSLLGWLFLEVAILIVGLISGPAPVAIFAAAARLVGLVTQPMLALSFVFLPALAREATGGIDPLRRLTSVLHRLCVLMIPALVAAPILLGRGVLASLGAEYERALPVLWILATSYAGYSCLLSSVPLIVLRQERLIVQSLVLGQGLSIAAAIALTPAYGAKGAAIAVALGLLFPKPILLFGYRRARLPVGGGFELALLLAIVAWVAIAMRLSGLPQAALLAAGGLASVLATMRLLSHTALLVGPRS